MSRVVAASPNPLHSTGKEGGTQKRFCVDGRNEAEIETNDDGWVPIFAEGSRPVALTVLAEASDLAFGTPPPTLSVPRGRLGSYSTSKSRRWRTLAELLPGFT